MDRPALKQLLADIEQGKVDCVVVYKVDQRRPGGLDRRPHVRDLVRPQVVHHGHLAGPQRRREHASTWARNAVLAGITLGLWKRLARPLRVACAAV